MKFSVKDTFIHTSCVPVTLPVPGQQHGHLSISGDTHVSPPVTMQQDSGRGGRRRVITYISILVSFPARHAARLWEGRKEESNNLY